MGLHHRCKGFGPNKRGIAAKDHYLVPVLTGVFGAEHGMAGAKLFFLDNRPVGVPAYGLFNRLSVMADNNGDFRDGGGYDRVKDMVEHGLEKDLMEDLGPRGFHPGALTRGQDNGNGIGWHYLSPVGGSGYGYCSKPRSAEQDS
jgi:hypothetical protein